MEGVRMPLNPRLLLSAVHIFGTVPGGSGQGTGFLMAVASEHPALPDHRWVYVVTAHHVIHDMDPVYVTAANCFGSGEMYPPRVVEGWVQPLPRVDLAIAPFGPIPGQQVYTLDWKHMVPTGEIQSPTLGSPVYYLGLFAPAQKLMARLGSVGALYVSGLPHERDYEYDCHLIDCRSYGGFSGSLCFFQVAHPALETSSLPEPFASDLAAIRPAPPIGEMRYLGIACGMFTEHYDDTSDPGEKPRTGEDAVSRYGVGVMLLGDYIKGALMTPKMKEQRREWDEELLAERAKKPGPRPKAARAMVPDASLDATADLMGKLMEVPKDEAQKG
jgi:hypothetical protein